jgi:uncharacterized membrane protein
MAEKKKIQWSKLILVASLGLNLVVVGLVAGAWSNGPKRGERGGGASWVSGPFGRALSDEDRKALGEAFRKNPEHRERLGKRRGEMRRIGIEIAGALRAEPFDPAALEALFEKQAQMGVELQQSGQQALMDRITAMTPEARASFADRLEKAVKRGRPSKGH